MSKFPQVRTVFTLLILGFTGHSVFAQLTEATLKGTVTDSADRTIGASSVKVRNEQTGLARTTGTNQSGMFLVAGIAPGTYTITVEKEGFNTFERGGLTLNTGQTTEVNIRLEIGTVRTDIVVHGGDLEVPVATEGRLSDSFRSNTIANLPLPQRDIFLLPKLSAGATAIPGSASSTKLSNSPVITVNGNRYRGNNYVLDGAVNVNPNNTGEPAIVPSLESVEEAQVQTGNFSSEFGRGNGAVINLRTKSGTNEIHGRLWEYSRNTQLNARNFFSATRPPVIFNQFGANVGGPIIKNKTFFFGSYEGTRSVLGQPLTFQVETPEFRDYVQRTAPNGVAAELMKRNPAPIPQAGSGSSKYAGQIDLPTPGGPIPAIGRAAVTLRNYSYADQYLGRIDHSFNDSLDKISVRWVSEDQGDIGRASSSPATLGKAARGSYGPFSGTFANLNLGHMHVFKRAVNDARFSFQYLYAARGDEKAILPDVTITGITAPFGDVFYNPSRFRTYEVRDTLTLDRGRHSLRIGFEYRRIFKGIQLGPATSGAYAFASLADFAADKPFRQTLTVDPNTGQPIGYPRYFHLNEGGLFLQEDWKVSSRLNISLGARWDYFGAVSERDGLISSLVWGEGNDYRERLANASVKRVSQLYAPQKLNISPRIGITYDPFGDGKTALRAGFSMAYQPHHGQSIGGARANPPDVVQGVIQPGNKIGTQILYGIPTPYNPEFGRGLNDQGGVISRPGEPAIRISPWVVNPTIKTQYSESWFFNLQREVAKGWIAEVGYFGTRGVNLERIDDINRYTGDLADGVENRINPNFGVIMFVTNGVNSSYHAGTAEIRHQFAHGFALQANYRFSKWLDTSSDTSTGQFTDNSEPGKGAQDVSCLSCEKGRSLFDIPHRFSANLLWTPNFEIGNRVLRAITRNWEISTIVTMQSGRPFSIWNNAPSRIVNGVNLGGDYNLDGGGGAVGGGFYDRPNAPTTPINTSFSNSDFINGLFSPNVFGRPALGTPGNLGRNTFRGPRYSAVDVSILRGFPIFREGWLLQFRADIFNVLNTTSLYLPNVDLSLALQPDGSFSNTSLFGKSTQAFDPRTVQVGVRFMF